MVEQWLSRLGLSVARSTAPAEAARQVIDVIPPRTLYEVFTGQRRKVRKEVIVDGHSIVETITLEPMTAEELRHELDAWRIQSRDSQWRRLR